MLSMDCYFYNYYTFQITQLQITCVTNCEDCQSVLIKLLIISRLTCTLY